MVTVSSVFGDWFCIFSLKLDRIYDRFWGGVLTDSNWRNGKYIGNDFVTDHHDLCISALVTTSSVTYQQWQLVPTRFYMSVDKCRFAKQRLDCRCFCNQSLLLYFDFYDDQLPSTIGFALLFLSTFGPIYDGSDDGFWRALKWIPIDETEFRLQKFSQSCYTLCQVAYYWW